MQQTLRPMPSFPQFVQSVLRNTQPPLHFVQPRLQVSRQP